MTLPPMPFIPLCHAFLEFKYLEIANWNPFCILCNNSNVKIVGISTISREQHLVAQNRELECTKVVLPQVMARGLYSVKRNVQHYIQLNFNRTEHCGGSI